MTILSPRWLDTGSKPATPAPPDGSLVLVTPFRILDTRIDQPDKFADGTLDGVGVPGLADHRGVVVNVTVTGTEGVGSVRVGHDPLAPPPRANVEWSSSGQTLANLTAVLTGPDASAILVQVDGGRTHVILDVLAYVA